MAAVTNLGLTCSSWIRLCAAAVRKGALIGLASIVLPTKSHIENFQTIIHVVVNYLINKHELILYIAMQFCLKKRMKNQGVMVSIMDSQPSNSMKGYNLLQRTKPGSMPFLL